MAFGVDPECEPRIRRVCVGDHFRQRPAHDGRDQPDLTGQQPQSLDGREAPLVAPQSADRAVEDMFVQRQAVGGRQVIDELGEVVRVCGPVRRRSCHRIVHCIYANNLMYCGSKATQAVSAITLKTKILKPNRLDVFPGEPRRTR